MLKADEDQALTDGKAHTADEKQFQAARPHQREHLAEMAAHDRQQDREGDEHAPEAERPGRHFRGDPFGGDIDAGRQEPAEHAHGIGSCKRTACRLFRPDSITMDCQDMYRHGLVMPQLSGAAQVGVWLCRLCAGGRLAQALIVPLSMTARGSLSLPKSPTRSGRRGRRCRRNSG